MNICHDHIQESTFVMITYNIQLCHGHIEKLTLVMITYNNTISYHKCFNALMLLIHFIGKSNTES